MITYCLCDTITHRVLYCITYYDINLDDKNIVKTIFTLLDEAEDPASTPVYWVSKWVDYSDKYGLGYALCDNSVGVLFNDQTRLILCEDGE